MADAVEVSCFINKNNDGQGYILLPKNGLDKAGLESFLDQRGRMIVVRLTNRAVPKSNEQNKAFWSLASLHYRAFNGKAPTSAELKFWEQDLLKPSLFPVREDSVNKGKFVPKDWRDLTKAEAIDVIEKMLQLVSEAEGLPASVELTCKDIFEWVNEQKQEMKKDETLDTAAEDLEEELGDLF